MTPTRGPQPGKGGPGPGRRHREAGGEGLVRRGVRPYALRRAMQALISHAARQGRLLARPFFLASSKRKLRRPRPGDKFSRRPRGEASSGGRRLLRAPRSMKNRARGPLAACEGVYVGDPLAHPEIGLRAQRPPPQPQRHPAFVPPLARARSSSGRPRPGAPAGLLSDPQWAKVGGAASSPAGHNADLRRREPPDQRDRRPQQPDSL